MPDAGGDVTALLGQLRAGNRDVAGQLVPPPKVSPKSWIIAKREVWPEIRSNARMTR